MRSLLLLPVAAARILHALPDDPAAFPKYKVDFLNHLPLANDTAQRWLAHGLRGGVREFLDQPWDDSWHPPALGNGDQATFGVADEDVSLASAPDAPDDYSLEYLKMGPNHYLCIIPKPLEQPPPDDDPDDEPTPAHSWSLLLPLEGTCLYLRQGWFTYSYCHGRDGEIRQFRELIQARPLSAGKHIRVNPSRGSLSTRFYSIQAPIAQKKILMQWEAYTLGRAPTTPEPGADLTVAQQNALAANLELARNAGSRYLVQRWGDGTLCDKTGKPREVEVQVRLQTTGAHMVPHQCAHVPLVPLFHDNAGRDCVCQGEQDMLVCPLVVHTPRLCGEPGFTTKDAGEQASISCREVIAGKLPDRSDAVFLPDADHPLQKPRRKPKLPLPPPPGKDSTKKDDGMGGKFSGGLRKALDMIKELQLGASGDIEMLEDGDGNIIIQYLEEVPVDGEGNVFDQEAAEAAAHDRIAAILREANLNIKGSASSADGKSSKNKKKKSNGDEKQDANDAADRRREVDELL
ncbi:PRKCSH domain-containing protein [Mycena venus]|uniref:Protein OS-9 homolog n=1 Tax=Mycena venus TaxID=2733690 RepID=A0A8H7CHY9_9AGAR|nr:PRKCSH domain-containing protein [Mycena venus]